MRFKCKMRKNPNADSEPNKAYMEKSALEWANIDIKQCEKCPGSMEIVLSGDRKPLVRMTVPHDCNSKYNIVGEQIWISASCELRPNVGAIDRPDVTVVENSVVNTRGRMKKADVSTMQSDVRPPVIIQWPNNQGSPINDRDIEELKCMMKSKQVWSHLVGGDNGKRLWIQDLGQYPKINLKVKEMMSSYMNQIQGLYPKLIHCKYTILRTEKLTKSQYEGCENELHCDYDDDVVMLLPPDERPMSVIVALDPFEFIFLPDRYGKRSDLAGCMSPFETRRNIICIHVSVGHVFITRLPSMV